ncbi:hypothetical protein, partial [Nocardia sp. NPDC049149]|uniref:hypothetical protein n=1 Tax=Nocardia sp. NPDC049149 TaxID=3364315 RepID=UPI00371AE5DF
MSGWSDALGEMIQATKRFVGKVALAGRQPLHGSAAGLDEIVRTVEHSDLSNAAIPERPFDMWMTSGREDTDGNILDSDGRQIPWALIYPEARPETVSCTAEHSDLSNAATPQRPFDMWMTSGREDTDGNILDSDGRQIPWALI